MSITSSNHDDSTVHESSTRDHILDVIGVTGTIDVGVVTGIGLILDMCSCDGDATLSLFGSFVNGPIF